MEPVPSTASLTRIFRDAGVAKTEPRKKPRSSYRRFVYPAPNACWQLDATEYVLTGGRKCVIFQLIDDHSRLAIASHVASGETSEAAIIVVKKGITAHGVPQRLLSDNGAALNPSRRGALGQLVAYLADGIAFRSRMGDESRMWAVFERGSDPVSEHISPDGDFQPVTEDNRDLMQAFTMLGLDWNNDI